MARGIFCVEGGDVEDVSHPSCKGRNYGIRELWWSRTSTPSYTSRVHRNASAIKDHNLLLRSQDTPHDVQLALLMIQRREGEPQRALRSNVNCERALFWPSQDGFSGVDMTFTNIRGMALSRCTWAWSLRHNIATHRR